MRREWSVTVSRCFPPDPSNQQTKSGGNSFVKSLELPVRERSCRDVQRRLNTSARRSGVRNTARETIRIRRMVLGKVGRLEGPRRLSLWIRGVNGLTTPTPRWPIHISGTRATRIEIHRRSPVLSRHFPQSRARIGQGTTRTCQVSLWDLTRALTRICSALRDKGRD